MTTYNYPAKVFVHILLILYCGWLSSFALAANDNSAIKAAFLSDPFMLYSDAIGYEWSISQADDEMEALAKENRLFTGNTDAHGNTPLTAKQRTELYEKWRKNPGKIWYIMFPKVFQIRPEVVNGHYQISLVDRRVEAEQAIAKAQDSANEIAIKTRLPKTSYTQKGFDAAPYAKDFAHWQERFKQDFAVVVAKVRANPDFASQILADKNKAVLNSYFAQSIAIGEKGQSLREALISSFLANTNHDGQGLTPSGEILVDLLLSKNARPVGYGDTFVDKGKQVELWYMVFNDMSDWNMKDFNESFIFSAFNQSEDSMSEVAEAASYTPRTRVQPNATASLPAYKINKRDQWPALVFVRNADGKIMMYGMSIEMSRILEFVFNKQIG